MIKPGMQANQQAYPVLWCVKNRESHFYISTAFLIIINKRQVPVLLLLLKK